MIIKHIDHIICPFSEVTVLSFLPTFRKRELLRLGLGEPCRKIDSPVQGILEMLNNQRR